MSQKDQMSLTEAAAIAGQWGQTIRAFARISDVLAAAQSAEQSQAEALNVAAKSKDEAAKARAAAEKSTQDAAKKIDEAQLELELVKAKTEQAKGRAKEIIDEATERARLIRAQAEADAAACAAASAAFLDQAKEDERKAIAARDTAIWEASAAREELEKARTDLAAFKRSVGAVA